MTPNKFTKRLTKAKNCPVCASGADVDYKDVNLLRKFLTERGKIQGRVRTGLCSKHQRQVTLAVKRARIMALLPFVAA